MKAVILAAGKGTRMLPITTHTPKPLIPINGKPFLGYVLDELIAAGITDAIIVVHYLQEQIIMYTNTSYGSAMRIRYVHQDSLSGTGDALASCAHLLTDEDFIVLSADNYYTRQDILLLARTTGCAIGTISTDHPERYGVVEEHEGRVITIHEKPAHPTSTIINCGAYRFTPAIFDTIRHIKPHPNREKYLTDAINLLAKKETIHSVRLSGPWLDLGTPGDIDKISAFLLEK